MVQLRESQYAVQLIGRDQLILNTSKPVVQPGPYQILAQVEVVGLCFSDLKLLKQFTGHARKGPVIAGIDPEILGEIPSYVPGDAPTVPGHETVVRIVAVGPCVETHKPGDRYLVQTDYRWLRTDGSNGSFGYNFEGGLQEYVLMDERVITAPDGESMLIAAGESLSGSAVALVEPWACVEDAYACHERTSIKTDGQMLIVVEAEVPKGRLGGLFKRYGTPAQITWLAKSGPPTDIPVAVIRAHDPDEVNDAGYDDVVYFGSNAATVEGLFAKVAPQGLLNVVLCGERFNRPVTTAAGRVHYGGIRLVGTTSSDPAESMRSIPKTGEIRHGDKINVVGAGGPMGMMHVIRNICQGIEGISVYAGDVDDDRLAILTKIAAPLAQENGVEYDVYNATQEQDGVEYNYTVLMAPIPELVAKAVRDAAPKGIVNIFAGIPAAVMAKIDLDAYIEKRLYFIGTSGSTLDDMKHVLGKVESGRLDTNVSVAAICDLQGALDGIRAVEDRSIAGKIVVYPACKALGLVPLGDLANKLPQVAEKLKDGLWTVEAERTLLDVYAPK